MESCEEKFLSPAKINWMLRVLRRREDGYHVIESLMSAVTLEDELIFTARPAPGVSVSCDRSDVPTDGENLIVRAAELLEQEASAGMPRPGWHCRLIKRIPVGGGLGGGSSNAATALKALNKFWELKLPDDRLHALAARLGSDVPFFLQEGSAIVHGRGERIEPVRLGWHGWIVLICPPVAVSTAAVYQAWRPDRGAAPHAPPSTDAPGLDCDAVAWMRKTYNMLEEPAMAVCPSLEGWARSCVTVAGRAVRVSGSGSTLFTAFDARQEAEVCAGKISALLGLTTYVVQPAEQVSHRRLHHGDHGSPNQTRGEIERTAQGLLQRNLRR